MRDIQNFRKMLETIREAHHVKVLEHGYRTRYVKCDPTTGKITMSLDGITDRLKKAFYPHENGRYTRKKRGQLGGGSSTKAGTHAHQWVRHLVNCPSKAACTCPRKEKMGIQPNIFAKRFLTDVKNLGYHPMEAEVPVWSVEKKLMTQVDVILRTPRGTLAAIEIKTGYGGDLEDAASRGSNRFLGGPFGKEVPKALNHVKHRHFLQAILGGYLFNHSYKAKEWVVDETWVVYLNDLHRPDSKLPNKTLTSWYPAHEVSWLQSRPHVKAIYEAI